MRVNLVNTLCVDKKEFFCRLRDFICKRNGTYDYSSIGIGWTLHDSSYAADEDNPAVNDWFVIYSPGENGKEDLYFRFKWVLNYISVNGFLFWNQSTNTGVHQYSSANNFYLTEDSSNPELSIYGDLDSVIFTETIIQTYDYLSFCGKLIKNIYDNTIATSADAVASGTDVSIAVDAVPSSWTVGRKIYIRDDANIKIITIKTISGSVVTADIPVAFSAGCKLQGDIGYAVTNQSNSFSSYSIAGHSTDAALLCYETHSAAITSLSPDNLNTEYGVSEAALYGANSYLGVIPNILIGPSGLTPGNVYTHGSDTYRCINFGNIYTLIKEA